MAASRKPADGIPGLFFRLLGDSESSKTLIAIALMVFGLAVGTYLLWDRFGGYVMGQPQYRLAVESIEMTPQPNWIVKSDVRKESATAASLKDLHIRRTDITLRVAQAFSMHPWVRKVVHVSKRYPARILVELDYRRPVAMVEVTGGWLPIDGESVLLPTADFDSDATRNYLKISAGESLPNSSLAGTAWGDDRVSQAALVAAYLQPHRENLNLDRILAYRGPNDIRGNPDYYFVIMTAKNTSVIWGRAPSKEQSGEPFAEQKLSRLQQFAVEQGSLDVLQPGQTIDLRHADRLDVARLPEDLR